MFTTMCPKEQQTSENLIVKDYCFIIEIFDKGPVKLIKRVKIAHSFLHSLSDQFHVIISSLPIYNSTNCCQRIFRNRLLKMEIWAILIFRVIFDKP